MSAAPPPPARPQLRLLADLARTATVALRRNRLRSGLTVLGISIGVAALIAVVAIGRGATRAAQEYIGALGQNLLIVVPGATTSAGVRSGWGGRANLTVGDAEAIRSDCPSVREVSYERREVLQVVQGGENWSTVVHGTSPAYPDVVTADLAAGDFFDSRDLRSAARVAVLGATVAEQLFGLGVDPIGTTLRIRDVPFRVVGMVASKGQSGFGHDRDDVVLVPYTTAVRRLFGERLPGRVSTIYVSARSEAATRRAVEEIDELLRHRHRIRDGGDADFTVRNLQDVAEAARRVTGVMTAVLLSVSGVSLVVGGIGIMNILLVSVTERTREIGIRMAVGARRRDVLLQFLVESALLAAVGGAVGVAVGFGASGVIGHFAGFGPEHSPWVALGAVLFSATVGLFFGFYPARRAARLDPITALRFE